MKFGWVFTSVLFSCVIAFSGCLPEKKVDKIQPTDPTIPPPPTPQEIAQTIITEAQLDMPIPSLEARFPKAKTEHGNSEDGQAALRHVILRIDKRIRDFSEAGAWRNVMVFIRAREVFEPNNKQYLALKDDADTQLRKPRVTVRGLPDLKGVQFVVLSFYIPITDQTFDDESYRIGDIAHGVKIMSIFGLDRGVTLRYLETGEKYVAFLPGQEK